MNKTEIPSDRGSKPEDSARSLPENSVDEIVFSQKTRTPLFVKGGIVMGILTGTVIGGSYLLNHTYNDNQATIFSQGFVQFRKVDGAYAHTVLTKGDLHYGKDFVVVQRNSWNKSRTYIGYHGCSSVDEIILQEGVLGTGISLEYTRNKDGELKEHMFAQADLDLQEQCARFKPLMENYLPNRLSR